MSRRSAAGINVAGISARNVRENGGVEAWARSWKLVINNVSEMATPLHRKQRRG